MLEKPLRKNPRYLLLLEMEMRGYFRHRRSLHLIPLLLFGVFLTAWIYPVGSPFAPVIIVVAVALELEFNNMVFRSPHEPRAMSLFPISPREIILAKNIATLALFVGLAALTSMTLLYFTPAQLSVAHLAEAGYYVSTILFPLLVIGNDHSIRNPRPHCGLRINDFLEAIWMLVYLGLLSLPFVFFAAIINAPALSLTYSLATAVYWYLVSIPRTAIFYEQEHSRLCQLH